MDSKAATGIRGKFVERFGEDQAVAIERAANEHANGINDENRGSDPFKWALLICLGYECISKDSYREHHGVTAPWDELKAWTKSDADLAAHDGDADWLSLLAGVYNEYMASEPAVLS